MKPEDVNPVSVEDLVDFLRQYRSLIERNLILPRISQAREREFESKQIFEKLRKLAKSAPAEIDRVDTERSIKLILSSRDLSDRREGIMDKLHDVFLSFFERRELGEVKIERRLFEKAKNLLSAAKSAVQDLDIAGGRLFEKGQGQKE
ncbi:MAG: hypothetical protein ACYS47_02785 [Planctomycetota bacterium]|jgi:SepF-like predicted cell division protein (DUF552 family)